MNSNFIPNNDNRWCIKKNILYYDYYYLIPVIYEFDGFYYVSANCQIIKPILLIINRLQELNIDFFFICPNLKWKPDLDDEKVQIKIITSYLNIIRNKKFFKGFQEINFDFSRNLSNYLSEYDLFFEFKNILNTEILKKSFFIVETTGEIQNYMNSLYRDVIINSFI